MLAQEIFNDFLIMGLWAPQRRRLKLLGLTFITFLPREHVLT